MLTTTALNGLFRRSYIDVRVQPVGLLFGIFTDAKRRAWIETLESRRSCCVSDRKCRYVDNFWTDNTMSYAMMSSLSIRMHVLECEVYIQELLKPFKLWCFTNISRSTNVFFVRCTGILQSWTQVSVSWKIYAPNWTNNILRSVWDVSNVGLRKHASS